MMNLNNHLRGSYARMADVEGDFTAAIRAVNACASDLRQHNTTAENRAMMRASAEEQERHAALKAPFNNDRK